MPELHRLALYDARGSRVATLDRGWRAAGEHLASWRPTAVRLNSGVYFLRLRHSGGERTIMVPVLF
jgi:hypothetical protein